MKRASNILCEFLDIDGVLLSDGWDYVARRRAAKNFKLEWAEMEARHHLTFEVFSIQAANPHVSSYPIMDCMQAEL